jgi:F0F1-type ATP synthase membrane subunit b/b'
MYLLAFAETIQLFPDGSLFIHIALILLMIWVLNRTLFRPINRVIESREKNKGGHSGEAVEILKDVSEKEVRYNWEMLDARSKGYELIEKENRKLAASREEKLSGAKAELAEKFATEKGELERQKADARVAIETAADKMAEKITANILSV